VHFDSGCNGNRRSRWRSGRGRIERYHYGNYDRTRRGNDRNHDRDHDRDHDGDHDRDYDGDHDRDYDMDHDRDYDRDHDGDHDRDHDRHHGRGHHRNDFRYDDGNYDRDSVPGKPSRQGDRVHGILSDLHPSVRPDSLRRELSRREDLQLQPG
jgi:hypothetical protein